MFTYETTYETIKLSDHGIETRFEYLKYLRGNKNYNKRINKIYSISDPRTETIFYIGCTIRPMHIRMREHFMEIGSCNIKGVIIRDLLEAGMYPTINVIYEIKDKTSARIAEKYITNYINKYGHIRHDLANVIGSNNVTEKINLAR